MFRDVVLSARVWWYRPGSWLDWRPVRLGSDEYRRSTVLVNGYLLGALVVAYGDPMAAEHPSDVLPTDYSDRAEG